MAVLQSTFNEDIDKGYPGMEADGELSNIVSLVLEGSTACAFGRPVYRGVADRGCTLTVTALKLRGFARATRSLPVTADRAADTYAPRDTIGVKERGKIWVACNSAAADGDPVYVTAAGVVSATSGGNTLADGWVFDDTIAAAGICRIVRR